VGKSKKPRKIDWSDVDNWYSNKYGQTDVLEPPQQDRNVDRTQ